MIEMIPNWHPVFVHFTIGLLFTSVLLFLVSWLLPGKEDLRGQLRVVALWNLWIGYSIALVTAVFGWLAFNSVTHDAASHEAMTVHRNWALTTLVVFLPVVLWSLFSSGQRRSPSWLFMLLLLVPALFLARTGWLGAEAVYRYGLGVMSLPKAEENGHAHAGTGMEEGPSHGENSRHNHDHMH